MAGVTDEKVGNLIDKIDDAVSDLLKGAKDAQGKVDSVEKYLSKLRNICDSI